MDSTIEKLVLLKDFSKLSLKEKQLVLSQITETEYNDIRSLLTKSKQAHKKDLELLQVNKEIEGKLLIAFKQKHKQHNKQKGYASLWNNHKKILKPVFSIAATIVLAIFILKNKQKEEFKVDTVSLYLNEKKELLKVNLDHSSDLIDSNKYNKDSILEMNNYLRINTDGLYAN
ncbi:hypothetical protein [Seonamhaeicola aphaedonensis]|uniref:Uncharacterized protein n=1 Tax=Seonamhaeicola aphaedonensis TaxID=1461338 RepID=A0A3D9HIF4_9FLAO|nr:hypothetical protein [Seonamhaeicola aphaedonensis]RED48736.1 hypothetical protein DFQ02_10366 [Seonamhaeicola aphaedonensis]